MVDDNWWNMSIAFVRTSAESLPEVEGAGTVVAAVRDLVLLNPLVEGLGPPSCLPLLEDVLLDEAFLSKFLELAVSSPEWRGL